MQETVGTGSERTPAKEKLTVVGARSFSFGTSHAMHLRCTDTLFTHACVHPWSQPTVQRIHTPYVDGWIVGMAEQ
jgi:hypothetical protein